ncbi:5120_t:CDS:2, partial [Cetraspora pellucida]
MNILHFALVVLDPQLKFKYFESLDLLLQLITDIKNIIKNKYENEYASFSDQSILHETTTRSTIMSQIYQSQSNEMNYSALSKFTRDCLSIPGTSVSSEQAFSIG